MKSVILCEGGTDLALIQYFMEDVNNWSYKDTHIEMKKEIKSQRNFSKNSHSLSIAETGGCSKLCPCFEKFIMRNKRSSISDEIIDKFVIISDRDEIGTVDEFLDKIRNIFSEYSVQVINEIVEGQWIRCNMQNSAEENVSFEILLLLIPFETTGALETFLLDAIAENDEYDKNIIDKGKAFVNDADPEARYLNKRRYKTKAEFDVYFSIRTAVDQFGERQNILKSVRWEEYELIQNSFRLLKDLS